MAKKEGGLNSFKDYELNEKCISYVVESPFQSVRKEIFLKDINYIFIGSSKIMPLFIVGGLSAILGIFVTKYFYRTGIALILIGALCAFLGSKIHIDLFEVRSNNLGFKIRGQGAVEFGERVRRKIYTKK